MKVFKCLEAGCTYNSSSSWCLARHLKTVHKVVDPKIYPCNNCNQMFGKYFELKNHEKEGCQQVMNKLRTNDRHVEQEPILSPIVMVKHERVQAEESSPTKKKGSLAICKICGKKFSRNISLSNHMKWIHENPNSFKCWICNKKHNTSQTLNGHILMHHTTIRPFQCYVCQRGFISRAKALTHISSCDKENKLYLFGFTPAANKFPCPFCNVQFVTVSVLVKHIRRHADDGDQAPEIDHMEDVDIDEDFDEDDQNFDIVDVKPDSKKCKKIKVSAVKGKKGKVKKKKPKNKFSEKMESKNRLENALECPLCDFETLYEYNLSRHLSRLHPERAKSKSPVKPKVKSKSRERNSKTLNKNVSPKLEQGVKEEDTNQIEENGFPQLELESAVDTNQVEQKVIPTLKMEMKEKEDTKVKVLTKRNKGKYAKVLWQCNFCDHVTKEERNLKKHVERLHPEIIPSNGNEASGSNDVLGKKVVGMHYLYSYLRKKKLARIRRKENQLKTFHRCEYCNYETNVGHRLTRHVKRVHKVNSSADNASEDSNPPQLSIMHGIRKLRKNSQSPFSPMIDNSLKENGERQRRKSKSRKKSFPRSQSNIPNIFLHCPFCVYETNNQLNLQMHVDKFHPGDTESISSQQHTFQGLNVEDTDPPEFSFLNEAEVDEMLNFQSSYSSDEETSYVKHGEGQGKGKKSKRSIEEEAKMFWDCEFCEFVTNNQRNLRNHVKNQHYDFPFIMPEDISNSDSGSNLPVVKFDNSATGNGEGSSSQCSDWQNGTTADFGELEWIGKPTKNKQKKPAKPEILLQCECCTYNTKNKYHFKRHIKRKHPKYLFTLPENTNTVKNELEGQEVENKIELKMQCELCSYNTIHEYHLKSHIQSKHPEYPFTVPEKKTATAERELKEQEVQNQIKFKKPRISKASLKSWPCELCKFVTVYKRNLRKHKLKVHPGHSATPPVDSILQYSTAAQSQVSSMNDDITSEGMSPQNTLSSVAYSPLKRKQTQVKKLKSKYNSFVNMKTKCNFCDYVTNYPSNISRHVKSHHPNEPDDVRIGDFPEDRQLKMYPPQLSLVCEDTEIEMDGLSSFLSLSEDEPTYERYDYEVHSEEESKLKYSRSKLEIATLLWQCNFCEFATNDKYNFKRHEKRHDPTDLTYMPVFNYDEESETNSHISIGSGTSEIGMSVSSSFSSEDEQTGTDIPTMEAIKTSTVLWQCNLCEYVTSDKSSFKKHAKGHEPLDVIELDDSMDDSVPNVSQSPSVYENELMRMSPQHPYNMNVKEESQIMEFEMHPQRPETYQCQYCNFGTKYCNNLKRHVRKLHPGENLPTPHNYHTGEDKLQPNLLQGPINCEAMENISQFQQDSFPLIYDVSDEDQEWDTLQLPTSLETTEVPNTLEFARDIPPSPPVYDISEEDPVVWFPPQFPTVEKRKEVKALLFPSKEEENRELEKCIMCDFRGKAYRMPIHMKVVHNLGQQMHDCSFCSYKARDKTQLSRHLKMHFNEQGIHECHFCDYKAPEINLRRHLKAEHQYTEPPVMLSCEMCEYHSSDQWRINRHRTNVHKLKPIFFCSKCQSTFPSKQERKMHSCTSPKKSGITPEQNAISSVYHDMPCLTPESRLDINDNNNSVHIQPQTKEMEKVGNSDAILECKRCGVKYSCQEDLNDHVRLEHSQENKKVFEVTNENQCHLCFVTCWSPQALVNHLKRHK